MPPRSIVMSVEHRLPAVASPTRTKTRSRSGCALGCRPSVGSWSEIIAIEPPPGATPGYLGCCGSSPTSITLSSWHSVLNNARPSQRREARRWLAEACRGEVLVFLGFCGPAPERAAHPSKSPSRSYKARVSCVPNRWGHHSDCVFFRSKGPSSCLWALVRAIARALRLRCWWGRLDRGVQF
jgi:hypothetical protein